MDSETGPRLKEIRKKLGLSQRQLAKASGVANATISQIESGALNPTVGMLKKVLGGIPISLSNFFADDFSFSDQVFFSADKLLQLGEGGVSYLQVGNHLHNKSIQMMKECYQPGAHTGKHAIQHEGEECGIILSGSFSCWQEHANNRVAGIDRALCAKCVEHRTYRNSKSRVVIGESTYEFGKFAW